MQRPLMPGTRSPQVRLALPEFDIWELHSQCDLHKRRAFDHGLSQSFRAEVSSNTLLAARSALMSVGLQVYESIQHPHTKSTVFIFMFTGRDGT